MDGDEVLQRGCAVIDLGAQTTTLTVFKRTTYLFNIVMQQGGMHITRAIAQQGVSEPTAEQLKCRYGFASPSMVERNLRMSIQDPVNGEVVFTSASNSETDFGFVLDYQVTDFYGDVCRDKTYYDQHLVLTDKRDNLISDDPYRASNVCEYTLELTNGNRLVYVFDKYDLREGEFIDVYNQENNSTLTRIAHYDFYNQHRTRLIILS